MSILQDRGESVELVRWVWIMSTHSSSLSKPYEPSTEPSNNWRAPPRVRGEHLLWGGRCAPPRRRRAARRRTTALYRAAVPGARDGQELDLPAPAQRGAPKREAGAHHKGKARGARRIPPELPLPRARPRGPSGRREHSSLGALPWARSSPLSGCG